MCNEIANHVTDRIRERWNIHNDPSLDLGTTTQFCLLVFWFCVAVCENVCLLLAVHVNVATTVISFLDLFL